MTAPVRETETGRSGKQEITDIPERDKGLDRNQILSEKDCRGGEMLVNFNDIREITIPGMNNGTGTMTAKMHMSEQGKIIPCSIHAGGSIGMHRHETSDDINYILSGTGKAVCDGKEEILQAGTCHICRKGSEHSIINTGSEDLVMLTVVVER